MQHCGNTGTDLCWLAIQHSPCPSHSSPALLSSRPPPDWEGPCRGGSLTSYGEEGVACSASQQLGLDDPGHVTTPSELIRSALALLCEPLHWMTEKSNMHAMEHCQYVVHVPVQNVHKKFICKYNTQYMYLYPIHVSVGIKSSRAQ